MWRHVINAALYGEVLVQEGGVLRLRLEHGAKADPITEQPVGTNEPSAYRVAKERVGGPVAGLWQNREDMENQYTGVFEQVGEWWIGHVEELPGCNVQERTLDEARESLKEAVQLIVSANRELARRESEGHEVVRESLAVPVE